MFVSVVWSVALDGDVDALGPRILVVVQNGQAVGVYGLRRQDLAVMRSYQPTMYIIMMLLCVRQSSVSSWHDLRSLGLDSDQPSFGMIGDEIYSAMQA
jgi:hypothetical protein